ncbi:hypothetical protein EQJ37_24335 [Salmonella enterica]|nr:hypothetical protein [Salmonella enterica]
MVFISAASSRVLYMLYSFRKAICNLLIKINNRKYYISMTDRRIIFVTVFKIIIRSVPENLPCSFFSYRIQKNTGMSLNTQNMA